MKYIKWINSSNSSFIFGATKIDTKIGICVQSRGITMFCCCRFSRICLGFFRMDTRQLFQFGYSKDDQFSAHLGTSHNQLNSVKVAF